MRKRTIEAIQNSAVTIALLAAATAVGWLFRYVNIHDSNVVIVYLLAVLLTARFTRGH